MLGIATSRRRALLAVTLSAAAFTSACQTPAQVSPEAAAAPPETGAVVAVVDGDTIDVELDGVRERVRIIGIDSPEVGRDGAADECWAREARAFLDDLLYGQTVQLHVDPSQDATDRYGRLLRHVVVDDTLAGAASIAAGAAYEYTYAAPYEHQEAYQDAQRAAAAEGAGLWSACV